MRHLGPTERHRHPGISGVRRRRVRKEQRRETRLPVYIRRLGQGVTMVSLLAYTGIISWNEHKLGKTYGRLSLGMDEQEIRYVQGPATRIENRRVWMFDDGKRIIRAHLDDGRRIDRITCVASSIDIQASCPLIDSVASGSSEIEVKQAFGNPTSESFTGDGKLIDYRGLGLTFRLNRGNVIAIGHSMPQGGLAWWRVWFWLAMP